LNALPYSDVEFSLSGLKLRGRRWRSQQDTDLLPVVALHGWMDNCGSFDFLARELMQLTPASFDIVALDLAGHGQSDARKHCEAYSIWQDIGEILEVANQLGWQRFALLGHSRGAMIATLTAATFPERVSHLAAIEALTPQPAAASDAVGQLSASIKAVMAAKNRKTRYYTSLAAATKSRARGLFELAYADAEVLAQRGVHNSEKGFYWGNDPVLAAPSAVKFTTEQLHAFVSALKLQAKLILASNSMIWDFLPNKGWLEHFDYIDIETFPGGHHLHMSEQAPAIALSLQSYFAAEQSQL
jgi:Predicted hydrolases or acyltransferases (alpha/beta hydrolase superfamily)